jgi:hypothetical protein
MTRWRRLRSYISPVLLGTEPIHDGLRIWYVSCGYGYHVDVVLDA